MLKIKRIEFENFLSFGGKHSFDFEERGIRLIKGINLDSTMDSSDGEHSIGSGKSTFCMVPQFALFGEVNKDINKNDVINKTAKENTRVEIIFEVNNKTYKIIRYRKYRKFKNDVFLFELIDDEFVNISPPNIRDTQKDINDIVLINSDTFQKTVLLTRDDYNQFLSFGSADRGKIFENLIQLNKLKYYFKKIKRDLRDEGETNNVLRNELIEVRAEAKTYLDSIIELEEDNKNKREKINKEIEEIKKEMKIIDSESMPLDDIRKHIEQYNALKKEYSDYTQELKRLEEDIEKCRAIIKGIGDYILFFDGELKDKETELKNLKPITCKKCGEPQNEDDIKKKRKSINDKIEGYKERIKEDEGKLSLNQQSLVDYSNTLETLLLKGLRVKTQMDENPLREEVKLSLEESNEYFNKIADLHNELSNKEKELGYIDDSLVEGFKNKTRVCKARIDNLKLEKEKSDNKISMLNFWLTTLDLGNENSIKQHIISQVVPVFNNIIQQNMDMIFHGDMILTFDNFLNDVILYNNESYSYSELSTGEKMKLNLVVNLSIFDMVKINLNGSSIMFLDEILVHVDWPTIKNTIDLIENKYSGDSCVYLISHDSRIQEYLETKGNSEIISIVKEQGESRIVQ